MNAGNGSGTGGASGGSGMGGPDLALPIEVLGSGSPDEPVIRSTRLLVAAEDVAAVQTLFVTCHRCGFYNAPEFEALSKPLTKVKASSRVVGGASGGADAAWVDITDANVQVDAVSAAHGGINGALVTIGFTLTLDAATRARLVGGAAGNQVEFRFNGTDGSSNGFRILDAQLRDASGKNLSPMTKKWADIAAEKTAGQAASDASGRGKALWAGRDLLTQSPIVPHKIRAACNDCHARDGRDLQYFNYSNDSIVQRSRFHGLTEAQGKDIAAYLRASQYAAVPHVAAAAPWNPPFQPGLGLDKKPMVEWSAGAGLDAVLPDGKASLKAFVGQPIDDTPLKVSNAELGAVMDPTKVLNLRELAVPLEFPDWNAWLPPVHPLDVWTPDAGQTAGLFETGYQGKNPAATFDKIATWLEGHKNPNGTYGDWSHLTANQHSEIQGLLGSLGNDSISFGGGSRGTRVSSDTSKPFGVELAAKKLQAALSSTTAALYAADTCGPAGPCTSFGQASFMERADVALYHWMGVKQWELVETYGLQDQRAFHGSVDSNGKWVGEGEARGWPYGWPSVFYIAPHMIYAPEKAAMGTREFYFSWEKRVVSYYRTNQWYQLQVTINPGWTGASNGAVDWPYTQGFIEGVADDVVNEKAPNWIAAMHLARYFQIITKLAQLANTTLPFDVPSTSEPNNLFANKGIQSKADLLFKLAPANLMDHATNQPIRYRLLDQIGPGVHVLFVNGVISQYTTFFGMTKRSDYRLCDPSNTSMGTPEPFAGQRFCLDKAKTPLPKDAQGQRYCYYPANSTYTTEQFNTWGLLSAAKMGADPALIKPWADWSARVWPD